MINVRRIAWSGPFAIVLLVGCIPSYFPIHSEHDVVQRDAIIGKWTDRHGLQSWQFQQADGDGYQLTYKGNERREVRFDVHLTEIGGALFMDLYPAVPEAEAEAAGFSKLHFVPVHTFFRVELTDGRLSLSSLQPNWLKRQAEQGKALPHVMRGDSTFLLTAETERLRQFVAEHLDTEGAFSATNELTRVTDN